MTIVIIGRRHARPHQLFDILFNMDDEDILQLVEEGTIEPDDISEFKNMDDEVQELVADGELDMDEAKDLCG